MSTAGAVVRLAVSNLAIPASAVLTGPILARELGPAGRGALAAVLTPIALSTYVFNFGVPQALTYVVAKGRSTTQEANRLGLILGALIGVLCGLGLIALTPVLLHKYPDQQGLFRVLSLLLPIQMSVGMLRYVAQARGRYELMTRERWFSVISRLVLIAGVALAGTLTVAAAAWFTHGTAVLATLLLVPILFAGESRKANQRETPRELRRFVLRYGIATWVGTVGGVLVMRLDQVLLTPLAGPKELGWYAVAVSVAEVPLLGLLAVRDVIFSAATDREDPDLVARATRTTILLAVPLCLGGILFAPLLLPPIFGAGFGPSVAMTQVLFLATIPSGVSMVGSAGLLASGRPKLASRAQLVAAVVTVVALFALVPPLGAIGAAYASLLAYLVAALLVSLGLTRVTNLRPRDFLVPRPADLVNIVTRVRGRLSAS
ncbi:MAG TPA: oligosaccharide flippase family protein [Thermoleophilaceae bacterium]|jgi:O-antigen/teichoic acid export membrane protein